MKFEASYRESRRRVLKLDVDAELACALRRESGPHGPSDMNELLALLESCDQEAFGRRNAAVRALLRVFQEQSSAPATTLLFLAYYPLIRALCRQLRDGLRTHELEERHAVIVSAFFEAAARTPLEPARAPTVLTLALKTRQSALRAIARGSRVRQNETAWTDAIEQIPAHTVTPEAALRCRETAGAVAHILDSSRRVARALATNDAHADLLLRTEPVPLSDVARALDPGAPEADIRKLHQRLRKQRSRVLRGARRIAGRKWSQIRGHLDLWNEEGWQ